MFNFRLYAVICTALLVSQSTLGSTATPSAKEQAKEQIPNTNQENLLPIEGLPKTWLQGTPVDKWEKDKVYIFEFWATWCGPCLAAMPHMEDLHHAFKDNPSLQIIGINVMERKTPEALKTFLKGRPTPLSYTIAVDTDGSTSKHWLSPLKVEGIPHAFAVKNGKLIWRGHPAGLSIDLLKKMLSSEADLNLGTIQSASDEKKEFLAAQKALYDFLLNGKMKEADSFIKEIEEKKTLPEARIIYLKSLSFEILAKMGKIHEAQAILTELANAHPDNYSVQMNVATDIMSPNLIPPAQKNTALAEQCLRRCIDISRANNREASLPWHQLALLTHSHGNPQKAVEYMEKALQLSSMGKAWNDLQTRSGRQEPFLSTVKHVVSSLPQIKERTIQSLGSTQKDEQWAPLFEKLNWNQPEKITGLPSGKTTIINFWRWQPSRTKTPFDSSPSDTLDALLSREGLLNHPSIKVITLAISPLPDSAAKVFLSSPKMRSHYPIGIPTDNSVEQMFSSLKLDTFPSSAVIRDGVQIWAGETKRMPEWVLETASRKTFDKTAFAKEQEVRKTRSDEMGKVLNQAFAMRKEKKEDEFRKIMKEHSSRFSYDAWYAGAIAEIQASEAIQNGKYQEAATIFDKLLTQFPKDNNMASYIMKILESSDELKANSSHVRRHALQIMHDANLRCDPGYNAACHEVMMKINMEQKNYDQAREDAINALKDLPLVQEYAAMLFPKK